MIRRVQTRLALTAAVTLGLAGWLVQPGWAQQDEPIPEPPALEQEDQQPRQQQPQPPATEHREHSLDRFEEAGATPADATMTHTGQFVRAQGNEFTMRAQDRQHSHTLGEEAQVTLNGRPAELSDLRPGDRIRVITSRTELGTALIVQATRGGDAQDAPDARPQEEDAPQPPQRLGRAPRQAAQQPRGQQQAAQQSGQQEGRGALGVLLDDARQRGAGVAIREVAPGSAADRAGLRAADRIVAIDEQEMSSPDDVLRALADKQAGEAVSLQIRRNDRTMNVDATLGAQRDLAFRQQEQQEQQAQPGQQGQPPQPPGFEGRRGQQQQLGQQGSQSWLGVMLRDDREPQQQPDHEEARQRGAVVAQVYPSGPAARAGLRSGDAIIRIGDHEVNRLDELYQAMDQLEPNEQVEITVIRNGEEQTLNATLASRQEFFGEQQFRGFRDDAFGGQLRGGRDFFGGAPEHSMMLEQQRHLAAQHQRLEDLLGNVLEEVKQLRQEVRELRGGDDRQDREDDNDNR
jgi:hypothetical protein